MLPPLWFVLLEALVLRCRCLHLGFGTIHQVRNQAQTRKLQEPAATVKENDDGHNRSVEGFYQIRVIITPLLL